MSSLLQQIDQSRDVRPYTIILLVGCDQITKYLAQLYLVAKPLVLLPTVSLILAHNRGAAFSLLARAGGWSEIFFISLSTIIASIILYLYFYKPLQNPCTRSGSAFILAGIFGNFYDRLNHGYVIDFIALHWHQWYWPIFNLADTALCLGVFCLWLAQFFDK